jgi:hypothetical protein
MPFLLPILTTVFSALGTAAPAIGAATGLAGLGESIYGATQTPQVQTPPDISSLVNTPATPPATPPNAATVNPSQLLQSSRTTGADLQARGGGGLSNTFYDLITAGQVPYVGSPA